MKSVIITGANRGIGLQTVLTFGRAGYQVFATMRNPNEAHKLKALIQEESLSVSILEMDVNSDDSVKKTMEHILNENDSISVLVNNAGIERHGSIEELEMSEFKDVMETNYFGAIRCIKTILPQMRHNGSGCIINISSVAGKISTSPMAPYAASKFALEALSEALAQEVKPFNIRVGIVQPGIINTDMAKDMQHAKSNTVYPQAFRFGGLFAASLENPTDATIVANKVLEIANSDSWKLRHPVGPDAEPFLEWRSSFSDEEWINWNAANDDDWYDSVEEVFGLDARAKV